MRSYAASVMIDRPVAEVFLFVGDGFVENYPRWAPLVGEVRLDDNEVIGPGARGTIVRSQSGRDADYAFKVTMFVRDQLLVVRAEGDPGTYAMSYSLSHVGDAQTQLDVTFSLGFGGLLGLVQPLMGRVFRREVARVASSIQTLIEQ